MSITKNSNTVASYGFSVNGTSSDLSGCEELVAAPAAGVSIYLTKVLITCVAAISVTLGAGETGGACTTILLGPITFAATSGSPYALDFGNKGIKLDAATSLTIDASGAGAVQVYVEGYTR